MSATTVAGVLPSQTGRSKQIRATRQTTSFGLNDLASILDRLIPVPVGPKVSIHRCPVEVARRRIRFVSRGR
jgi:hypothetical protein